MKRRKTPSTASLPRSRAIPVGAYKTRSPRNQSVWAKRLAPVTTAKKNAVKAWASEIALGEVGAANGRACMTCAPKPIYWKNAIKLSRPPNCATAFDASTSTIFAPPKNGVKVAGAGIEVAAGGDAEVAAPAEAVLSTSSEGVLSMPIPLP